ncbi:MAG TPA: UDP-N-acetylmuramate dehydrogenase [Flavitalea sp.]|nr:UDP-N-acetylmuramate dehydrogenase [Flavitalea sp.]
MKIDHNYSLKPLNTFAIDVMAKEFSVFRSPEELEELISLSGKDHFFILGGGSNILLTKNFDGYVLKNEISGIQIIKEDDHHAYIKARAGENWHQFVQFCIDRNLAGVENLSLIPGSVGASPMQNIGAYGVELKDVFHDLEAFHIKSRRIVTFSHADCHFGYRESVFKNKFKGEYVILSVTFRLNRTPHYNTSYGAIEDELKRLGKGVSIQTISQAVINIRSFKLPDPVKIGNAGSFFKNPEISAALYDELKKNHPAVPAYPHSNNSVKIAAGWLIEQCGWKGYRKGDAGVHERQALVIVNYGNATGEEIYDLSEQVRLSVIKKFNIGLEREVNVI